MQEWIEDLEMHIGKIESGINIKTKTDIALLRMRVELLESRVKELDSRVQHIEEVGCYDWIESSVKRYPK